MTALVDRAATVGEAPWWVGTSEDKGQWTDLGDKPVTAEEMMIGAGQNWRVQVAPLTATIAGADGFQQIEVPNRFAIVRDDTLAVLGYVTDRYEPVQNHEAFSFFDEVIGPGQAVYHTAGSLEGGKIVWILAALPEMNFSVGGVDAIESFILLATGHDGNFAFRMQPTRIRVVCKNTLNAATDYGKSTAGFRLSHFNGIRRKLNAHDAQVALGLAKEEMVAFRDGAEQMAQTTITEEEIKGFVQRLFPLPQLNAPRSVVEGGLLLLPEPKKEDLTQDFTTIFEKREVVETLINEGVGNSGETRWDAFNGVAEFTDYVNGWDSKRSVQTLFGTGRDLKQTAWNLLT